MDVPRGSVNDPAWQTAFWYRGSALPGERGTMTVAGHVTDLLGQPGAFVDDSFVDRLVVYARQMNAKPAGLYEPQQRV